MSEIRKGQVKPHLTREEFRAHFQRSYFDPNFDALRGAIAELEEIAWTNYRESRKAPVTKKAGPGFADPDYDVSVEWLAARDAIAQAEQRQKDAASPSRVLLICASSRNDGTCPGEMSKTFRLVKIAEDVLTALGVEVDLLDLSHLNSEYGLKIHPCKACVSTAMPLCHWPCSCYPNHSLGQADDWMAEIYPRFAAAHGVLIVTPVYWDQATSPLKLMMDRMVCADGGNADVSSTHGKKVEEAKAIELKGWDYPKHLAGRTYGVVVHGDVSGAQNLRRMLSDWLEWLGFIPAGEYALVDRFIGYYQPYATSHDALDADEAIQEEVRNAARALTEAVRDLRAGGLPQPGAHLHPPRQK